MLNSSSTFLVTFTSVLSMENIYWSIWRISTYRAYVTTEIQIIFWRLHLNLDRVFGNTWLALKKNYQLKKFPSWNIWNNRSIGSIQISIMVEKKFIATIYLYGKNIWVKPDRFDDLFSNTYIEKKPTSHTLQLGPLRYKN